MTKQILSDTFMKVSVFDAPRTSLRAKQRDDPSQAKSRAIFSQMPKENGKNFFPKFHQFFDCPQPARSIAFVDADLFCGARDLGAHIWWNLLNDPGLAARPK